MQSNRTGSCIFRVNQSEKCKTQLRPLPVKRQGSNCQRVVTRPNVVTVEALDINMEPFILTGEGLLARAICHECEHLDGILYVEHVEGELHDVNYEEEDGE